MPKMIILTSLGKKLKFWSNSVARQVNFKRKKMAGNAKNESFK